MANKPYRSDAGLILMILAFPFWVMWWVAKSIVALVVFIINVIKKKRYEGRAVRIESGKKLIIPVYGEHYAQKKGQSSLMNEMFSDAREFSLTPQCDYQKKTGMARASFRQRK